MAGRPNPYLDPEHAVPEFVWEGAQIQPAEPVHFENFTAASDSTGDSVTDPINGPRSSGGSPKSHHEVIDGQIGITDTPFKCLDIRKNQKSGTSSFETALSDLSGTVSLPEDIEECGKDGATPQRHRMPRGYARKRVSSKARKSHLKELHLYTTPGNLHSTGRRATTTGRIRKSKPWIRMFSIRFTPYLLERAGVNPGNGGTGGEGHATEQEDAEREQTSPQCSGVIGPEHKPASFEEAGPLGPESCSDILAAGLSPTTRAAMKGCFCCSCEFG